MSITQLDNYVFKTTHFYVKLHSLWKLIKSCTYA